MRIAVVLLAVGVAACGPIPINDSVSPTKVVSTAPAAIQVVGSTRPDQQLAVSAIVTTLVGQPVSGLAVTFTVTAGTITPATVTTDSDGYARAVASQQFQNTITAKANDLSYALVIKGPAPEAPLPLTVSISAPGSIYEDDTFSFGVNLQSGGATAHVVRWNFGDGDSTTANTFSPSHRYGSDGNYTVTLDIADNQGRTASASKRVTVLPAPTSTPVPSTPQSVTAAIVCTIVTPIRRSCTATPMFNGVAIAGALVASMTINWGDGASEPATTGVALSHNYALGTTGNKTIRVTGSLTTGETFDSQITIGIG